VQFGQTSYLQEMKPQDVVVDLERALVFEREQQHSK
jgi:hypothetical protein